MQEELEHPSNLFEKDSYNYHRGMSNYTKNKMSNAIIFLKHSFCYDGNSGNYKILKLPDAHALAAWLIRTEAEKKVTVSDVTDDFKQNWKKFLS
jgi:hypothetical protein